MEIQGNKIIFKALVGSHSYGTNVEGSDEDYKGVFIQSPEDVLEHGYREQIDLSKDEVYYELGRFLRLCATGNPTMLELLYTPRDCMIYADLGLWGMISEKAPMFLTKSCKFSFGGYAVSQIKKAGGLDKKMNWEKERIVRKTVEDFCYVYPFHMDLHYNSSALTLSAYLSISGYTSQDCGLVKIDHIRDCYLLFCDDLKWLNNVGERFWTETKTHDFKGIISGEDSNDVCLSEVPKFVKPRGVLYFNKDAYSIHCKDYREYESWLKNRNTQRYVDVGEHGQQVDGKNLLHCVRLIETGIEIAQLGTINVKRPNAEYLIEIRKGKHNLKSVMDKCELDLKRLDEEFMKSTLPEKIDEKQVERLIKNIRKEYYKQTNENKEKTSNP